MPVYQTTVTAKMLPLAWYHKTGTNVRGNICMQHCDKLVLIDCDIQTEESGYQTTS